MSEQCLELKNVCKSFRDFTLNNISFTLPQGYIMGLVGPNGAGKTTTIQLILNMLEKDAGKILAFGKDNVVSEKEIKQDIGIVFDSIFYVDSWTVKDTEKAVSIFYDNWRHDIFNDMVKRFDLPFPFIPKIVKRFCINCPEHSISVLIIYSMPDFVYY